MRARVELENIEEMRLQAGIDDVGLREEVRRLRAGDFVKLTARVGARPPPGDPLLVRVTSVGGGVIRGKLAGGARLSRLKAGSLLIFTAANVHSVTSQRGAGGRPAPSVSTGARFHFPKRQIG
jgi:hypothetical protein